MRLHNKSALITGAGSGIGRAIAQEFAREGARVAIADIDLSAATQAAGEIQSTGGIAIAIEMDVTNETQVDAHGRGGSILYLGSIHSHIASPNKSAYVAAKHGIAGLAKAVAKEGAKSGIRSNVICPGFVRTALVEKQIPQQAQQLGITEEEVVRDVMLRETVDGEFTSLEDVAATAVFLASFPTNALTGQSIGVSHGHVMQ